MKPSFHSLIDFLPLFCSCQFRRLDSVQFLCSQAHIPAGGRLETRLSSTKLFFITILHRPCKKHSLPSVAKACLQRRFIAMRVTQFLLAYSLPLGMCLPSRCLAVNFYSDFTIPAFGRVWQYYNDICRIWGFHSGGYKEYCLLGYNAV
jgi:hypothetical protein